MALKILAYPVDDKRKASVQTIAVATGVTGCTSDVVDIRGFANFTFIVSGIITISSIVVSSSAEGPFYALNALGTSAAPIADIPPDAGNAYDVPELAGCHYVALDGLLSTETVQLMGKV